jgi:hypothetical protein
MGWYREYHTSAASSFQFGERHVQPHYAQSFQIEMAEQAVTAV